MARVFCTNCGNAVYLDEKKAFAFCTRCGNRLDADSPAYSSNKDKSSFSKIDRTNECRVIKANKKYDGACCNICGRAVQFGEPICLCNNCNSVNHESCWTNSKGCSSLTCLGNNPLSKESKNNTYSSLNSRNTASDPYGNRMLGNNSYSNSSVQEEELVHCKWCKEPINKYARVCIHCNRPQYKQPVEKFNAFDGGLQVPLDAIDWLLIFCCPFTGLIVGIFYHLTGNPKANRLLAYSFITMGATAALQVFYAFMTIK